MEERSDLQTAAVDQPPSDAALPVAVLLISVVLSTSVVLPISVALLIALVLPIFVALLIAVVLPIVVAPLIVVDPLIVVALPIAAAQLVVAAAQRSAAVEVVAASPAPQQPPALSAVAPQQLSAGAVLQERAVTGSGQEKATP